MSENDVSTTEKMSRHHADIPDTALALSGVAGSNGHVGGFLAALQEHARRHGSSTGIPQELKMITCTSGAITLTARFLQGKDLREEFMAFIESVDRVTRLPRESWADPLRQALVLNVTGLPGIFGPSWQALARDARDALVKMWSTEEVSWPTPQNLVNAALPAGWLMPQRTAQSFEPVATAFNAATIGIAFNSFDIFTGYENLYVNEPGMELIARHHDRNASYGNERKHTVYSRITPEAVANALWLLYYGFDRPGQLVDGCYARSIIMNELTFASRIFAVKPVNDHWLGAPPKNYFDVRDLETDLWMSTSYRQQRYQIELVNQLIQDGRIHPPRAGLPQVRRKHDHVIDIVPVEIKTRPGYFKYFVESPETFDDARSESLRILNEISAQDSVRTSTPVPDGRATPPAHTLERPLGS